MLNNKLYSFSFFLFNEHFYSRTPGLICDQTTVDLNIYVGEKKQIIVSLHFLHTNSKNIFLTRHSPVL